MPEPCAHGDVTPPAFAVEIEPHKIGADERAAQVERGMTQARIGLQDFDPGVQAAIGRGQDFDRVAATFADLRGAGVRTVSVERGPGR